MRIFNLQVTGLWIRCNIIICIDFLFQWRSWTMSKVEQQCYSTNRLGIQHVFYGLLFYSREYNTYGFNTDGITFHWKNAKVISWFLMMYSLWTTLLTRNVANLNNVHLGFPSQKWGYIQKKFLFPSFKVKFAKLTNFVSTIRYMNFK